MVEGGFNGKMTEIHAALGIANLKYFDDVLKDRKEKYLMYLDLLGKSEKLKFQRIKENETNYSYFPVIFTSEEELLKVEKALNEKNIFPRRYFYPSVNTYTKILNYQSTPISEDISKRIMCLPLFYDLNIDEVESISNLILQELEH